MSSGNTVVNGCTRGFLLRQVFGRTSIHCLFTNSRISCSNHPSGSKFIFSGTTCTRLVLCTTASWSSGSSSKVTEISLCTYTMSTSLEMGFRGFW